MSYLHISQRTSGEPHNSFRELLSVRVELVNQAKPLVIFPKSKTPSQCTFQSSMGKMSISEQ